MRRHLWKPLVACAILVLLTLGSAPASSTDTISVKKISLPTGSVAVGLAYSGGYVYYASYVYGFLMRVDPATMTYVNLTSSTGAFNSFYFGMAFDWANDNIWLTRRDDGNNGNPAGVTVSTVTGVTKEVLNSSSGGEWDGIGVVGGYAWVAQGSLLYKISLAAPYSSTSYSIAGGGGAYYGMVGDGDGNVWFSDILGGQLFKFSPSTSTLTGYSGFNRPLGVTVNNSTVYVAENCRYIADSCTPSIAEMSTGGGNITRVSVVGSPFDVAAVSGRIVWTSSAEDANHTTTICVLWGACVDTGETNYYLSTDAAGNVYFSYYGSSGVGVVSGLVPVPPSSTTLTSAGAARATVSGFTGVEVTFTNTANTSILANVYFAWYNSGSQIVAIGAQLEVTFGAGENMTFFSAMSVPPGTYAVQAFAWDINGFALSPSYEASVTIT